MFMLLPYFAHLQPCIGCRERVPPRAGTRRLEQITLYSVEHGAPLGDDGSDLMEPWGSNAFGGWHSYHVQARGCRLYHHRHADGRRSVLYIYWLTHSAQLPLQLCTLLTVVMHCVCYRYDKCDPILQKCNEGDGGIVGFLVNGTLSVIVLAFVAFIGSVRSRTRTREMRAPLDEFLFGCV